MENNFNFSYDQQSFIIPKPNEKINFTEKPDFVLSSPVLTSAKSSELIKPKAPIITKKLLGNNESFDLQVEVRIKEWMKTDLATNLFDYYDNEILKLAEQGYVSYNFQFHKGEKLLPSKSIEILKSYCRYRKLNLDFSYHLNDGSKANFIKFDFIRAVVSLKNP